MVTMVPFSGESKEIVQQTQVVSVLVNGREEEDTKFNDFQDELRVYPVDSSDYG